MIIAFLGIDHDQVVDAQWADNGPGWVALLLADAKSVLALQPAAVAGGRFDAIGVIGPIRRARRRTSSSSLCATGRAARRPCSRQPQRRAGSVADRYRTGAELIHRIPRNRPRAARPDLHQQSRQRDLDWRRCRDWRVGTVHI